MMYGNKRQQIYLTMYVDKKKRLSLLTSSGIREEVDNMLAQDYQLLNHDRSPSAILQCRIPNNTPIINQYISFVQQQYCIPNPLHHKRKVSGNKLKLSLAEKPSSTPANDRMSQKSKRKLHLTSKHKQASSQVNEFSGHLQQVLYRQNPSHFDQMGSNANNLMRSNSNNPIGSIVNKLKLNLQGTRGEQSGNRMSSKEKQKVFIFNPVSQFWTTKRQPSIDGNSEDNKHNQLSLSRKTIKKSPTHQQTFTEIDSITHILNPISSKIHRKQPSPQPHPNQAITINYRNSQAHSNQQLNINSRHHSSNKVKQSYRYCIGCQLAILQANIKSHEIQCEEFMNISNLSNPEIIDILKFKISRLGDEIQTAGKCLEEEDAVTVRGSSLDMLDECKRRKSGSGESALMVRQYGKVMAIGARWCTSIDLVTKLKWFLRVLTKLQSLAQSQQKKEII